MNIELTDEEASVLYETVLEMRENCRAYDDSDGILFWEGLAERIKKGRGNAQTL